MIYNRQRGVSKYDHVLNGDISFSTPLKSIQGVFEDVALTESAKIKKKDVSNSRYFAGTYGNKNQKFKEEIVETCIKMNIPKDAIEKLEAIEKVDQFYVGVDGEERRPSYRVYWGSFDKDTSVGNGSAIVWQEGSKNFKVREYAGYPIDNIGELKKRSMAVLRGDKKLNDLIFEFLLCGITEKEFLEKTNSVISLDKSGEKRNTIDVSLDYMGRSVVKLKKEILNLLDYFKISHRDRLHFFFPPTESMTLSRVQWGTDSDGQKFINIYYI